MDEILALEDDPLQEGSILLRRTKDYYRVYTHRAKYRIIYRVLPGKRTILIERIRPRRTAYSGLE